MMRQSLYWLLRVSRAALEDVRPEQVQSSAVFAPLGGCKVLAGIEAQAAETLVDGSPNSMEFGEPLASVDAAQASLLVAEPSPEALSKDGCQVLPNPEVHMLAPVV